MEEALIQGQQCKYQAYQSQEEPALFLEVINGNYLPFRLFAPGELKIAFKAENDTEEVVLTMELSRTWCKQFVRLPYKYWNRDFVCHLKYRSFLLPWRSLTNKCTRDKTIKVSFCLGYMTGKWEAIFSIEMNERKAILHDAPWLCDEEIAFLSQRKKHVLESLRNLDESIPDSEAYVPNVAIIGSGGGMRAVIGMGSAVETLKEEKILDCAMHVSGVSGSAWYLLALYANDKVDPKEVNSHIQKKLGSFSGVLIWMGWHLWKYYTKGIQFEHGKFYSFTNIFGEMIGHLLLTEGKQKWSEQKTKLEKGKYPLPLIAALHGRQDNDMEEHDWIEFSPYQVYTPRYGIAIQMNEFGDEFEKGTCASKYKEPPIHFLQGIVGSAYATLREYKLPGYTWYSNWCNIKDYGMSVLNRFETTFIGTVPNFLVGRRVYQLNYPDAQPVRYKDTTKDCFHEEGLMLVDAGLACNSPYPLVLHPSRKVDIIISFDFSNRDDDGDWPFKHLVKAEKWAKEKNVRFPEIENKLRQLNIWEHNRSFPYEEVYVFEGLNSPTIVHFVLINRSFKNGDADRDFEIFPRYGTFRFYYSTEEFDRLKELVKHNITQNKHKIIECFKKKIETNQRKGNAEKNRMDNY